jgi:arylsulfatase A-like enzyme
MEEPMPDSRPNILLFFADDQRFDTICALGNDEIITPNLDKLVERGTAYTNASIMGGTAGAICMPSRAMLMTGRSLFHLDREGQDIPADHVMMGEALRSEGYNTFGTGKWHNGRSAFARSFSHGDRVFFGGMSDHFKVPLNPFDPSGEYPESGIYHEEKLHSSDLFSEVACNFLNGHDSDDPFFLYLSFTAPHDPRDTHPKYHAMYDADKVTVPENFMEKHPFDQGDYETRDEKLALWPRTPEIIQEHLAAYYAMITHLDAQVGQVLDALESAGKADNTIVVFAGDNGLAVGQHGLLGKQNMYDHSVRVPLVFSGPGIPRGERREAFTYLIDIYPTLFELAGLGIPSSVEGTSLVSTFTQPDEHVRETLIHAYKDFQRAARDRKMKLIEYCVDGKRTTQLFDTSKDPWETENLSDRTEFAGDVSRLRGELDRWHSEYDDPTAPWWND